MLYAVLVVALVALDQLVKYLVVQNIPLGEYVPFLPHILDLTYVQNTGAAFSLFSEHTWLLTPVSYTHLRPTRRRGISFWGVGV